MSINNWQFILYCVTEILYLVKLVILNTFYLMVFAVDLLENKSIMSRKVSVMTFYLNPLSEKFYANKSYSV